MPDAEVYDFTPDTKVIQSPGYPTLLCRWRAFLDCGCCVWVGIRADNQEAATGALHCSEDHRGLIERFQESMNASLLAPTDRPLIDVVAQMLGAAADGPQPSQP